MQANNPLYAILMLVSALASTVVGVIVWRRRSTPGAMPLLILAVAMAWWDLTYFIHWIGLPRPTPNFWVDATYVGVLVVPASFFTFILYFTAHAHWLKKWMKIILIGEPILSLLLFITDKSHGIFFAGLRVEGAGSIMDGGPGFWFNIVYSNILLLCAFMLLFKKAYDQNPVIRQQARILLFGALFPWFFLMLGLAEISPTPNLDLTPLGFTFTSIIFTIGFLRFHLLDIVPLARDRLVENLRDGVIVFDAFNRVVDINPAAQYMLTLDTQTSLGKNAEEVCKRWPELVEQVKNNISWQGELVMEKNGQEIFLDVNTLGFFDHSAHFAGQLVEFRDITYHKKIELDVRKTNQQLQTQLDENQNLRFLLQEQAIRDSLTGLYNRRQLGEAMAREIARCLHTQEPLAVVLMDIDHFKTVNDRFGHLTGDLVLESLGRYLLTNTRSEDFACRYGGEEFLVIMPKIGAVEALRQVEEWRSHMDHAQFKHLGQEVHITLSAGIALYPQHGKTIDELLYSADTALYLAKNAGRNRVLTIEDHIP